MKKLLENWNRFIDEEAQTVLENFPNPDFQRRAHGGKTCDEWNKEITEFEGLLQDAHDHLDVLRHAVEDGDETPGEYSDYLESGAIERAKEALSLARRHAKEQKCQVDTSPRRKPEQPKNKALELLKLIGKDIINWPRDMVKVLNYYYGDGKQ